jgi:DNA-directed RNA polymerase sigma subunit (sigma70/sigma32)
MSNYCFFNYVKDYLNSPPSDKEIAHMNNISVETVKKVEKEALAKVKEFRTIKDMDQ